MNIRNLLALTTVMLMASSSAYAFGNNRAKEMTKDDATLLSDVQSKITSSTKVKSTSSPHIIVDVKEGKVTIYGIVNTKDQKKEVEKAVKEVDGVKDVDSEIMVKD